MSALKRTKFTFYLQFLFSFFFVGRRQKNHRNEDGSKFTELGVHKKTNYKLIVFIIFLVGFSGIAFNAVRMRTSIIMRKNEKNVHKPILKTCCKWYGSILKGFFHCVSSVICSVVCDFHYRPCTHELIFHI